MNGSTSNRCNYIDGLGVVAVLSTCTLGASAGTNNASCGIVRNATSGNPNINASIQAGNVLTYISPTAVEGFQPSLGFNYMQAMELMTGSGTFLSQITAVGLFTASITTQVTV
jgi:hypothetical protein